MMGLRRNHPVCLIAGSQARSFTVPLRPDLWIFRPARTAVKAERSEFIVSLDGGRSRLHRRSSGRRGAGLILAPRESELSTRTTPNPFPQLFPFPNLPTLRFRFPGAPPRWLR